MTLGEFIAGCIGFFIGVLILDVFCLFYHGRNLFRQIGDALGISAEKEITEFDDLLPPAELPVLNNAGIPSFAVVDDDNAKEVNADCSAIFALEKNPNERPTSIVCGIKTVPASEDISVMIIGFGYPKQEHVLCLYNYKGDIFGTIDVADAFYVRVVKKSELNK